jgi:MFS family permease
MVRVRGIWLSGDGYRPQLLSACREAPLTGLILTYASFAIAFFFRPLGAIIFGRIGDRIGRKPTLIIVLVMMTLATTAIGLVPVYASIGIAAPLILTGLRILQGLFAGGEYGGAVSLMTEFAPRGKRGLYGAWQSFTVALGLLAGAGIVALISAVLSPEELYAWGWRLPSSSPYRWGAWRSGYG